jgi:DNA polymerase-3 subunit gamma/tau
MLTKEAFNALLKTMEEPPSHVKFILCTTEPHKVPATIQSRCQRFDFRALSTGQIAEQLDRILSAEGIEADGEVVRHVARLGNGSMRDALSLLDRLLSAGEARLTVELLEELLGLPDHTLIESLVDAVATGDAAAALGRADELLRGGATVDQALELLAQHLRTLLVASACGPESDLIDLAAESRATAIRQAERFDAATLVHLIALCDATARNARASAAARALFDAAVVRMALSERMADIATLLERGGDAPGPQKKNDEVSPPAPSREPVGPAPRRETTPAPDAAAPGAAVTEVKLDLDGEELWRRVLASASAAQQRRLGYLHFEAYDGRRLRLSIGPEGAAVSRWLQAQSDGIADLVHRVAGRRVTLELDVSACEAPERAADAADLAEVERDPAVRRAMELFDAVVVDVETSETSEGAQ